MDSTEHDNIAPFTPQVGYYENQFLLWWNRLVIQRVTPDILPAFQLERQTKVGPFYLDLYNPASRTGIEIDGKAHHDSPEQILKDMRRQAYLEASGILVIRFTAQQVRHAPKWCIYTLKNRIVSELGLERDW
jgi:very-short-patch-repair endonuclease